MSDKIRKSFYTIPDGLTDEYQRVEVLICIYFYIGGNNFFYTKRMSADERLLEILYKICEENLIKYYYDIDSVPEEVQRDLYDCENLYTEYKKRIKK